MQGCFTEAIDHVKFQV